MVYCRQAGIGDLPAEEGFAEARDAFEKALAIDSNSAEAHAGLGLVAMSFDRDLAAAARHYQRALTLQPGNGEVLGDATLLALSLGRIDIATSLGERALVRDPINLRAHRYLGATYYLSGRPAEAAECYRRALALSAGYITGHYLLGRVLLTQGEAQAAMKVMQQESHPVYKLTGLNDERLAAIPFDVVDETSSMPMKAATAGR